MYNPPHPGEFITEVYLEPNNISVSELATVLNVSPSIMSRVLNGSWAVSPTMALRLSKALSRSPCHEVELRHLAYSPKSTKLRLSAA